MFSKRASGSKLLFYDLRGEGAKVQYRALRTGPIVDGLRVVRDGLKPGERIVVNGLQRVQPGMVIKPRSVPMEGDSGAAAP